jgi:hypothetical protein
MATLVWSGNYWRLFWRIQGIHWGLLDTIQCVVQFYRAYDGSGTGGFKGVDMTVQMAILQFV